jgi:hypothetical protein
MSGDDKEVVLRRHREHVHHAGMLLSVGWPIALLYIIYQVPDGNDCLVRWRKARFARLRVGLHIIRGLVAHQDQAMCRRQTHCSPPPSPRSYDFESAVIYGWLYECNYARFCMIPASLGFPCHGKNLISPWAVLNYLMGSQFAFLA